MESQSSRGYPAETPRKKIEGTAEAANQPGGGPYSLAPRDARVGPGHSEHYKRWCSYREQGEAAARSADQGAMAPQGASLPGRFCEQGGDNANDGTSSRTTIWTGARASCYWKASRMA